ncbi:MAG: rhomboid-like protein, partial [Streptosporangiaceae bacterium]
MLPGLLRRYPVPVFYLAVLGSVSAVYAHALSVDHQRFLVGWASTNLANLSTRPLTTLVASAFLSQDTVLVWVVVTSLALVLLVQLVGNGRAALLVAAGHVIGTLVSQGIAAWRLALGAVPAAI